MKKTVLLAVAAALALPGAWAAINSAYAPSGAHYANGAGDPICTVDSAQGVNCTATTIGGVGHTNATVVLSATYSGTVQCRNHGGQVVEVKTQKTEGYSVPNLPADKNGQLAVPAMHATAPSTQDMLDQATCPNPNWNKELVGGPVLVNWAYTLTFKGFQGPAISLSSSG